MEINDYCKATYQTVIYKNDKNKIDYLMLGLVSEVGELASIFKRVYRDVELKQKLTDYKDISGTGIKTNSVSKIEKLIDGFDDQNFDVDLRHKVMLEIGDVMWYVARLCVELNIPMDTVLQMNLDKLSKRKTNNTLRGSGDYR